MLSARALTRGWGGRPVIEGLHLEIARGGHCLIHGPSGSGKSTLLHMLGRLLAPDSGEITFDGTPYARLGSPRAFRLRHIGFLFQDFHLLESLTVEQNVEIVALARDAPEAVPIAELLEPLGLLSRRDARVNTLSRGERQRVALARAFANSPSLVLADEPTASLDPSNRDATLDHLFALCARTGATCVTVAHDPALAERADFASHWRLDAGALQPL